MSDAEALRAGDAQVYCVGCGMERCFVVGGWQIGDGECGQCPCGNGAPCPLKAVGVGSEQLETLTKVLRTHTFASRECTKEPGAGDGQ